MTQPAGGEPVAALMLLRHATARDDLLSRIVPDLEADARVAAAWLAGSFGRGDADEWSDLDLHIAVADEHFAAFWAGRLAFYERFGHPVLIQPEIPGNTGIPGGSFQLVLYPGPSGPIEVDWSVGPARAAVRPGASRLLFDRISTPVAPPLGSPLRLPGERRERLHSWVTFFWAMAPIAVKYAARGETAQAVAQMDLLTNAYAELQTLLERSDADLAANVPGLGRSIDPGHVLRVIAALCAATERLHPTIEAYGASVPAEVSGQVARLVSMASQIVGEASGDGPQGAR